MAKIRPLFVLKHAVKEGRSGIAGREGEHLSIYYNARAMKAGLVAACARPKRIGGIKVEILDADSPVERFESAILEVRRYRCEPSASGKVRPVVMSFRQKRHRRA